MYTNNVRVNEIIHETVRTSGDTIVGLTEPHRDSVERVTALPNKNVIQYRRDVADKTTVVRAALYSNDLLLPFPEYISPDMATGRLTVANDEFEEIIVTSVYMDIDDTNGWPKLFEQLVVHCNQSNIPLLVMTDSNAQSKRWGNKKTNSRGAKLESMLLRHNLKTHNKGRCPRIFTYYRANAKSMIDLTITNHLLRDFVTDWHTTWKVLDSDHVYIEFKIRVHQTPPRYYRNLKRGSWYRFQQILSESEWDIDNLEYDVDRLERETCSLHQKIDAALDITHPHQKRVTGPPSKEWYDKDVIQERGNVKRAHDTWRKNKNSLNHTLLKEARKTYRKVVRQKQHKSWQAFVSGFGSYKDVAAFKKILNRILMLLTEYK